MALNKYYLKTQAEMTNTIKADAQGLLFNYFLYNLNTSDGHVKLYLVDDNGNEIILLETDISAGQKIYLEEKLTLEGEDIKIYSDIDNVQVIVQILTN